MTIIEKSNSSTYHLYISIVILMTGNQWWFLFVFSLGRNEINFAKTDNKIIVPATRTYMTQSFQLEIRKYRNTGYFSRLIIQHIEIIRLSKC